MKVWVCQVRKEAFVGGESQRCRHPRYGETELLGCGEMELIGGEPVEWCVTHGAPLGSISGENRWCWAMEDAVKPSPCQFESQIRVGP